MLCEIGFHAMNNPKHFCDFLLYSIGYYTLSWIKYHAIQRSILISLSRRLLSLTPPSACDAQFSSELMWIAFSCYSRPESDTWTDTNLIIQCHPIPSHAARAWIKTLKTTIQRCFSAQWYTTSFSVFVLYCIALHSNLSYYSHSNLEILQRLVCSKSQKTSSSKTWKPSTYMVWYGICQWYAHAGFQEWVSERHSRLWASMCRTSKPSLSDSCSILHPSALHHQWVRHTYACHLSDDYFHQDSRQVQITA